MAHEEAILNAIKAWKVEFKKVSKDLLRYSVFKAMDQSFAQKYAAEVGKDSADAATITTFLETERTRYMNNDINSIDPITIWDIISGVMWPTITKYDTSLVDHPGDGGKNLVSMRGVAMKFVFNKDGTISKDNVFNILTQDIWTPFFKENTNALQVVTQAVKDYGVPTPALKKKILAELFSEEDAAALMFLRYGNMVALGYPIQIMATLNPYLGYFLMVIGWLGGSTSINSRKIDLKIKDVAGIDITKLPKKQSDAIASAATIGVQKSLEATMGAIGANYDWLQKQKNDSSNNKAFSQKWIDRFMNDPSCILNQVIVLNEKVNINNNNAYRYSPKAKQRMTDLGGAYVVGFNITTPD